LTHPEFEQGIRDRWDILRATIRQERDPVPPERLIAERTTLRHPLYTEEKRRLRARRGKRPGGAI